MRFCVVGVLDALDGFDDELFDDELFDDELFDEVEFDWVEDSVDFTSGTTSILIKLVSLLSELSFLDLELFPPAISILKV